jgi:hypothetical protein
MRDGSTANTRFEIAWRAEDGGVISCVEKLKVLRQNLQEIEQTCQDAFEDALLMGCDEQQIRDVFQQVILSLRNPYSKK